MALYIVLIIHMLCVLLRVLVGFQLVHLVHALGLNELIQLAADETCQSLLGECVTDLLACCK